MDWKEKLAEDKETRTLIDLRSESAAVLSQRSTFTIWRTPSPESEIHLKCGCKIRRSNIAAPQADLHCPDRTYRWIPISDSG